MTREDKWYLDGWRLATRTIREYKPTRPRVAAYLEGIVRAKFGSAHGDAWNMGRRDACEVALGLDV